MNEYNNGQVGQIRCQRNNTPAKERLFPTSAVLEGPLPVGDKAHDITDYIAKKISNPVVHTKKRNQRENECKANDSVNETDNNKF